MPKKCKKENIRPKIEISLSIANINIPLHKVDVSKKKINLKPSSNKNSDSR